MAGGTETVTYTLVFRITTEVMDALERGEKVTEYRDDTPFWTARMKKILSGPCQALFLCGKRQRRYNVKGIGNYPSAVVPERWAAYIHTPRVWAVELGERIGEELARRMEGRG